MPTHRRGCTRACTRHDTLRHIKLQLPGVLTALTQIVPVLALVYSAHRPHYQIIRVATTATTLNSTTTTTTTTSHHDDNNNDSHRITNHDDDDGKSPSMYFFFFFFFYQFVYNNLNATTTSTRPTTTMATGVRDADASRAPFRCYIYILLY